MCVCCVCVCYVCWAQSCLTLCDPVDYSLPGSSVYGVFQARIWTRLTFPTPGNLPDPGIEPVSLVSPALAGGFFTTDLPGKPICVLSFMYTHTHTHTPLPMVSSLIAQTVKSLPLGQVTRVQSLGLWDPLEKGIASYLENSMNRGAWQAMTVHGVTKSQTQLSN